MQRIPQSARVEALLDETDPWRLLQRLDEMRAEISDRTRLRLWTWFFDLTAARPTEAERDALLARGYTLLDFSLALGVRAIEWRLTEWPRAHLAVQNAISRSYPHRARRAPGR